jgi:hypothetical protein
MHVARRHPYAIGGGLAWRLAATITLLKRCSRWPSSTSPLAAVTVGRDDAEDGRDGADPIATGWAMDDPVVRLRVLGSEHIFDLAMGRSDCRSPAHGSRARTPGRSRNGYRDREIDGLAERETSQVLAKAFDELLDERAVGHRRGAGVVPARVGPDRFGAAPPCGSLVGFRRGPRSSCQEVLVGLQARSRRSAVGAMTLHRSRRDGSSDSWPAR